MTPTLTLAMDEWKRAANELFQTSSRTATDFINGQALGVAIEAVRNTKFVPPAQIAWQLGRIGERMTVKPTSSPRAKKKYTAKKSTIFSGQSLAMRILGKRMKEHGTFGVKGAKTIEAAAEKLIRSRMRSAHFIQSGWIPARRALFSVVHVKPPTAIGASVAGAKVYGRPKGWAIKAVFKWSQTSFAQIANTALLTVQKFSERVSDPKPIAEEGLTKAMMITASKMRQVLADRLRPDFRKVSVRV